MIPGIHVSTSGGLEKAPARLRNLNLSAGQIFTANQRRWKSSPLSEKRVETFRDETGVLQFVSHGSYLINLASSREDVLEKSELALSEELHRCSVLGIPYLVLHPGAYQENGLEKGIEMIAGTLGRLLSRRKDIPLLLLENTAGAGTTVGRSFQELKAIREQSMCPEKIGYCIDTAHAHGAGYMIGAEAFKEELDSVLGAENVKVFHLNGSKVEQGSRRDRHEHFNTGFIEFTDLKKLYDDQTYKHALGIAETPGTDQDRAGDMMLLAK